MPARWLASAAKCGAVFSIVRFSVSRTAAKWDAVRAIIPRRCSCGSPVPNWTRLIAGSRAALAAFHDILFSFPDGESKNPNQREFIETDLGVPLRCLHLLGVSDDFRGPWFEPG